jgi:hypothetical protein
MISVAEASERILARIGALSEETVATGNAAGRVLSSAVTAGISSPPWDNSLHCASLKKLPPAHFPLVHLAPEKLPA